MDFFEGLLDLDLNGDGIPDAMGVDFDGDGAPDVILMDSDGDGVADISADIIYEDLDGDGISDAVGIDYDGDGVIDEAWVDLNGDGMIDMYLADSDGDGVLDIRMTDSNGDGMFDLHEYDLDGDGVYDSIEADTDHNGIVDTYITVTETDGMLVQTVSHDYNENGVIDDETIYMDTDGVDGFDVVIHNYSSDGNDFMDMSETFIDVDGDGSPDMHMVDQFLDTDGDQVYDTYIHQVDENYDGIFDAVEIYDASFDNGEIFLTPLNFDMGSDNHTLVDLDNFDPETADMEHVTGHPAESMQEWEYQGDTGRCALYSQKFVIEELSGEDLDIEEFADIAEANGWFNEDNGTPLLNMNKMLNYFGIDNEMSFNNSIDDIERILQDGGKIIVSVDADEIWYGEEDDIFSPDEAANHAVEVIGIDHSDPDNPMVILNDSGSPDGCGEMVPLDVFVDAWEDGNCQMIYAW